MDADDIAVISSQLAAVSIELHSAKEQWTRIEDQCRKTNGRVTVLEMKNIAEEAARAARAEVVESTRKDRAEVIATKESRRVREEDYKRQDRRAWPGWVFGGVATFAVLVQYAQAH